MKFADRPLPAARYNHPIETETLRVVGYSDEEIDLVFEYERAGEPRKIYLGLSTQEAKELFEQLKEAFEEI